MATGGEPRSIVRRAAESITVRTRRVLARPGLHRRFGHLPDDGRLRIVTGADSVYFGRLLVLLDLLEEHEPDADLVVWDLGLTGDERTELARRHPDVCVETFDFDAQPPHFDIDVGKGQYAWKPVIIDTEVRRSEDMVVWLDTGCLVTDPLRWFRRYTTALGIYTPRSTGTIRDWTHPGTLERLEVDEDLLDRPNFSGGVVGVDPRDAAAVALVARWAECAHDVDIIAPAGSDRTNHRQDQAVLSVLLHQGGLGEDGDFRHLQRNRLEVRVHGNRADR